MDFDLNAGRIATGDPAPPSRKNTAEQGKYVLFATPSLGHQVSIDYFRSSIETSALLRDAGIGHTYTFEGGNQFIARARNWLVTDFLKNHPNASDLFFIDDDLGWDPYAALRILESPKDVVAGLYPEKCDGDHFPGELNFGEPGDGRFTVEDGLFLANYVPGGFLRIKRHVLELMAARSAVYKIATPQGFREEYDIFQTGACEDGQWWGEDYQFCQRWRAMDGKIWIDPDATFHHSGRKRWTGSVADQLRKLMDQMSADAASQAASVAEDVPATLDQKEVVS